METWHKISMLVYLGYAAFYKDETHYGVCPYAEHGNLSFIVRVKVK